MKSYPQFYSVFLMLVFCISCRGQVKTDLPKSDNKPKIKNIVTSTGPNGTTRNIIQDKKGNIWIAAFDGIFRYDGKSFANITNEVSSARFFSVLEDRKGNLWFGSIGSGVYYYDGKSFRNFTTEDGLLNNEVGSIYEDTKGNVWFGVNGGASCYDGKTFRNYRMNGDVMSEDRTGKTSPVLKRPPNEVSAIIEDKTGKLWFATRGNTFVYDGKTFTVFARDGKPFTNVRSIIEDKKGNIWLGGNDGLWRYDGSTFTHFTQEFVGYIYEDKKGNIWTSSERDQTKSFKIDLQNTGNQKGWSLSRYHEKSLANHAMLPELIRTGEGMIFGILEADDGNIWFGTLNGVYRYDGKTITRFNEKKGENAN
ncbi:two-component regulator propeller domain-containing protein [Parapedobacter sp. 2B3]|uniref:ligand-binding sensor domain-containing protein n=1 Tax=Parapedobacter sp. 2B3 TaxID=3342381 RepID=UPI0035B69D7E